MTVAVVHVNWSRSEVAAALEAVRSANAKVGGRNQALEQLGRAERKLLDKANPKARVALHFGERPLGLLGAVLAESADPAAFSALTSLQKAALSAKNSNHNEFWSLLKQTRQQPIARKASWISWRRS